jgi:hypothetical protein
MIFGFKKFEIIFTAIIGCIILLSAYVSVQREKSKMSVENFHDIPGIVVDVESVEDVYNALDGMHSQAIDNMDSNDKLVMWLADKMDEMHYKFDLDESKLQEP